MLRRDKSAFVYYGRINPVMKGNKMKLKKTKLAGNGFYYKEGDRHIGERIALEKFEPYLTKLILENIKRGEVFVDVGANIGYYTVLAADKGALVWAYEPEDDNFLILTRNIEESCLSGIKVYKKAVGDKTKKVKLLLSKTNFGDHRISSKGKEIDMVSLDDAIGKKVDVIKIDVQGWEPGVIEGAKKIIQKYKPMIVMEYWPKGIKRAGLDENEMLAFLKGVYGKMFVVDEYTQIYYPTNNKGLDKLMKKNRREDCSLLFTKETDWWKQYRDFWPKKWLKRFVGRYSLT